MTVAVIFCTQVWRLHAASIDQLAHTFETEVSMGRTTIPPVRLDLSRASSRCLLKPGLREFAYVV